jgi:hypothetical protein
LTLFKKQAKMVTDYTNYRIEVKNVSFIADDGRTCPMRKVKRLVLNYLAPLILTWFIT